MFTSRFDPDLPPMALGPGRKPPAWGPGPCLPRPSPMGPVVRSLPGAEGLGAKGFVPGWRSRRRAGRATPSLPSRGAAHERPLPPGFGGGSKQQGSEEPVSSAPALPATPLGRHRPAAHSPFPALDHGSPPELRVRVHGDSYGLSTVPGTTTVSRTSVYLGPALHLLRKGGPWAKPWPRRRRAILGPFPDPRWGADP